LSKRERKREGETRALTIINIYYILSMKKRKKSGKITDLDTELK